MIRHPRHAVAGSIGLVLGGAVIGLMMGATAETCAGAVQLLTGSVLMLSVIGAVCGDADDRPRLLTFAVFGWGYVVLTCWYSYHEGPVPTVHFVPGSVERRSVPLALPPYVGMAHAAWALGIAFLGSLLAPWLFLQAPARARVADEGDAPEGSSAGWWRKPAVVGLLGVGLVAIAWLVGRSFGTSPAAGTVFLLTWALLGQAVVGSAFAGGRRREAWIGAASFGLAYMALAFCPVASRNLPTNHLLNAVFRPGGPKAALDLDDDDLTTDEESRRLRKALEEPVSLHFPGDTPLGTVLKPIKDKIRNATRDEPIIYGDWEELRLLPAEMERLTVSIDCENIPSREALRLALRGRGLTYRVHSGYIRLVPDAYRPVPFEEDPVMIAGHSLLALIAAAVGGAAAPIVAGLCRGPRLMPPAIGSAPLTQ